MKKIAFFLVLTVLILANAAAQQGSKQAAAAEITFTYTKQGGVASNQFAIWVEDEQGNYIKTLYATRFTANGGWKRRAASLPLWVKQSNLAEMSGKEIDAISSSTPKAGNITYSWNGTNDKGKAVPDGAYVFILEATLRNENFVIYRIPVSIGKGSSAAEAIAEYSGESTAERSMIANVKVKVLR